MHAVQEQQQTLNSSIFSWDPTSNYKDSTQADKPESVPTSLQPLLFYINIKEIWERISSSAAMMFSVLTLSCLALRESTYNFR